MHIALTEGRRPYTLFPLLLIFSGQDANENLFWCCGFSGTDCPRFVSLINVLIWRYTSSHRVRWFLSISCELSAFTLPLCGCICCSEIRNLMLTLCLCRCNYLFFLNVFLTLPIWVNWYKNWRKRRRNCNLLLWRGIYLPRCRNIQMKSVSFLNHPSSRKTYYEK